MNRRLLFILLLAFATIAAASLAACGGSDDEASDATQNAAGADCDTDGEAPGISDDTIKLGALMPLTGPAALIGATRQGLDAYFTMINEEGGIDGRQIDFTVLDDKYDPAVAIQQIQRLDQQEGVFAVVGGAGTPNFVAILPYVKANEIPVVAGYGPAPQVGNMDNPNVYMPFSRQDVEFEALADYVINEEGAERVALVYLAGDVGDDAINGAERGVDKNGQELVAAVASEATTTNYAPQALELKESGADWVLLHQTPTGQQRIIQAMQRIGFNPKLAGVSDDADAVFVELIGEAGHGMVVALKVTPTTSDDPQVQEFVTQLTEQYEFPEVGEPSWQAVGWVSAMIAVEALRNAPALTRDCFDWALQNMKDFDTGFLPPVSFSPTDRQATEAVAIGENRNGEIFQVAPFVEVQR